MEIFFRERSSYIMNIASGFRLQILIWEMIMMFYRTED